MTQIELREQISRATGLFSGVSGIDGYDPSAMKTDRSFHFHSFAAAACDSTAVRRARVRRTPATVAEGTVVDIEGFL